MYVDKARNPYRGMLMCHMLADTLDEWHAMADRLGLKRSWFQPQPTPHYDICQLNRARALPYGALEIFRKGVVVHIRRYRAEAKAQSSG